MTARPPPADLSGHVGKLVLCEEFLQNAISAKDWYYNYWEPLTKAPLSRLSLVFRSIIDIQYTSLLPSNVTDIQMSQNMHLVTPTTKETTYFPFFMHTMTLNKWVPWAFSTQNVAQSNILSNFWKWHFSSIFARVPSLKGSRYSLLATNTIWTWGFALFWGFGTLELTSGIFP